MTNTLIFLGKGDSELSSLVSKVMVDDSQQWICSQTLEVFLRQSLLVLYVCCSY